MTPKQAIVAFEVSKGVPVKDAMKMAGYKPGSIKTRGHSNEGLQKLIKESQEKFLQQYYRKSNELGFTPEFTVQRLNHIARHGKDFDSIAAIKEHHRVIFRPLENGNGISFNGIFIVPSKETWKGKEEKIVDVGHIQVTQEGSPTESNG